MTDRELLARVTCDPKVMVGKPVIKGTRITVTGRLTLRTWTGKDGSIKEGLGLDVDAVEAPRQEAPRSDFDDDGMTYTAPNTSDDLPF